VLESVKDAARRNTKAENYEGTGSNPAVGLLFQPAAESILEYRDNESL